MHLLNIVHDKKAQQLRYDYDSETGVYTFESDIIIGEWTVSRIIKIGGPRTSAYKYDFKNYFEFVITDRNGDSQILTWHHNSGDDMLAGTWAGDTSADALPYFFAEHPVFTAVDWKDYKSVTAIKEVGRILKKEDCSASWKVHLIAKALEKVQ